MVLATAAAAAPRAASIGLCADQYLLMLADPAQIVSVSSEGAVPTLSHYWREARRYPVNHGTAEEVFAAGAEVVFTPAWGDPRTGALLERFGVRVVPLPYADDFAGVEAVTRTVAGALGHSARGEAVIAAMRADIDRARALRAGRDRPLAAYFRPDGGSAAAGTFVDAVLDAAGADNLTNRLGKTGWAGLSLEELVETPPDVLLTSFFDRPRNTVGFAFSSHGLWQHITADTPTIDIPGARWTCGTPLIAAVAVDIARALTERGL